LRTAPRSWQYIAWRDPELTPATRQPAKEAAKKEEPKKEESDEEKKESSEAKPKKQKTVPGAEVVITVTPNGIILSSEDLDALDQMEAIFLDIQEQSSHGGKEYTIFYLRHAKADVAADLLTQALGGGSGDDGGGGGSLMGDIASSMFGGSGGMGGLMGAMMGGGGGGGSSVSSGPVLLIPDNRLNAILAQGKPGDLDLAEQLLKIIDQQASKVDIQIIAKPRFIPVYHTTADEMAATIRQVYANRMAADPSAQRQPSPQELMQALRGGGGRGGRGGGGGNDRKSEEQKMTIGVDAKSNSLIVSAPPALFDEIAEMVKDLDIASTTKDEYVGIHRTPGNTSSIEKQLTSILGDSVTVTVIGASGTTSSSRPPAARNNNAQRPPGGPQGQPPPQQQFNPQQMQSFIQAAQGGGGGQRGGGNRGGGGGGRGGGS
jgi:type II secretory pathway component GspD/PulD (secretin)